MSWFRCTVLDGSGKRLTSVLQALDAGAAVQPLREQGCFVLEVLEVPASQAPSADKSVTRKPFASLLGILRPVTAHDRILFFRQLSLMLRSGLPLLHSLEVLRDQSEKPRLSRALSRIIARIQEGGSLSASMEKERALFPVFAVKLIATGEATGELTEVLSRVADQLERRAELRSSILTSLTYPALVVVITTVVVVFLVAHVIPKFKALLAARNLALPPSTQFLMDASDFFNAHWQAICASVAGLVLALMVLYATRPGRYAIDRTLLSIPVVGRIILFALMAHFVRTLAVLLKSGVPMLDALRLLTDGVHNSVFARQLKRAQTGLLEGRPLSRELKSSIAPGLVSELISVGEATGAMDAVLDDLGSYFEERLKRQIKWMATLFEPAMILMVGSVVGFVYISFFQALYQISAR